MLGRFKNKNYKKQWNSCSHSYKAESLYAWTDLRTRAHAQLHKHTSVNNNVRTYASCFFIIIQFVTTYYDDLPPDDSSSNHRPRVPALASFDDVTLRPPTSLFSVGNGWRLRGGPRTPACLARSVSANFLALAQPSPHAPPSNRLDYNNIIFPIFDAPSVLFLIFSCFFFLNYNYVFCKLCSGRITRCQQPESLSTSPSTSSEGAFSCRSSPSPPLSESSSSAAWSGRGLPSVVDEGIGLTDDDFEDVPKRKKVSSTICYYD